MVVAYRLAWLTARLVKPLLSVPWFSLPNLLAGRELVQEFSQDRVTAQNLGRALLELFEDPKRIAHLRETFAGIHRSLRKNASERAAEAVLELTDSR